MSKQTNKPLHDWVRQSLDTYRPDYNPDDWAALQRSLRRRRLYRRLRISSGLLLLGALCWLATKQWMNPTGNQLNKRLVNHKSQPFPGLSKPESSSAINPSTIKLSGLKQPHHKPQSNQQLLNPSVAGRPVLSYVPSTVEAIRFVQPIGSCLSARIHLSQPVAISSEETAIARQMITGNFGLDSTSYQALNRNINAWPDAVVVCDLTTSMYPYTTQLFAWFAKHARNPAIKGLVFFTDCDSLGKQTHPGGPAGQLFVTRDRNPAAVLPILLAAARNTVQNEDEAENDIEALLAAQEQFPEARQLILVADNISSVKDMALLGRVRKPVHVVLCGTTGSDSTRAFQADYYEIASRTGGSLHTLEDDLIPTDLSSTTTLRVGSRYYRYSPRKHRFKLTPFGYRPKRFLKFIWL